MILLSSHRSSVEAKSFIVIRRNQWGQPGESPGGETPMDLDTQGHLLVYEKTKTDKNTSIIGKDNEHYQRLVIYKGGIVNVQ